MVSVGKSGTGRPICKPLKPESYFPTYNDAYAALAEYNRNPYALEPAITAKQLYEKWTVEYAIKYIVGHAISDITEKIYTDRELQWLKDEIEKIK